MSEHYDLDLSNSGAGWMGTFGLLVQKAVDDITDDGPYGPVEVTLDDGTVLTGVLDIWSGDGDAFTVTEPSELPRIVEIDEVVRLRA